ncbi:PASTA domain-containing protein [Cryomorphaceae bacterium]|nr:PASTA domain-containing protein [Cryomorphaceae bacterium]
MGDIIEFLRSKLFWRNVIVYGIILVVGFFGLTWWLSSYTQHGETVLVPDLRSYTLTEAGLELEPIDLGYAVIDSAEFNPEYPRGAVVGQIPGPGNAVKRGRTIFFTVNPRNVQKVILPNLIDRSKRQAISYLETYGFQVGELTFVPDMARDVVVGVEYNGEEVEAGDPLPKRAVIDLILGNGLSDEKISVPWTPGLTLEEAEDRLKELSLNVGALSYDETVEDSSAARVYRQYPDPNPRPVIRLGMSVDLWLTEDSTKIPLDTLFITEPDTLQNELVQ